MATGDQQAMTVEGLRLLAKTYTDNALRCRDIGDYLKRQTNGMFWQSNAASSFQQNMTKFQRTLEQFEADFQQLSQDLRNRADMLERDQNR